MEYVLYLYTSGVGGGSLGYYLGKKYTHQGEHFPCTCNSAEDAKKYTSIQRAKSALESLNKTISYKVECTFYFRAASNNKFEPTRE